MRTSETTEISTLINQLRDTWTDIRIEITGDLVTVRGWRYNDFDVDAMLPVEAGTLEGALRLAVEQR